MTATKSRRLSSVCFVSYLQLAAFCLNLINDWWTPQLQWWQPPGNNLGKASALRTRKRRKMVCCCIRQKMCNHDLMIMVSGLSPCEVSIHEWISTITSAKVEVNPEFMISKLHASCKTGHRPIQRCYVYALSAWPSWLSFIDGRHNNHWCLLWIEWQTFCLLAKFYEQLWLVILMLVSRCMRCSHFQY